MKFVECLTRHRLNDRIGVVMLPMKDIEFYTVKDIIVNSPYLFDYEVLGIKHNAPVVMYYLGILRSKNKQGKTITI